jgi:hypothetical protein
MRAMRALAPDAANPSSMKMTIDCTSQGMALGKYPCTRLHVLARARGKSFAICVPVPTMRTVSRYHTTRGPCHAGRESLGAHTEAYTTNSSDTSRDGLVQKNGMVWRKGSVSLPKSLCVQRNSRVRGLHNLNGRSTGNMPPHYCISSGPSCTYEFRGFQKMLEHG